MRRFKAAAGFTLIEVLVAMTIMSVMAMMAWQGVDSIVRARDASQDRLEQSLRIGTVMAQWEQDLASAQDSAPTRAIECDGSTVRLTRRTEGGLQVVAWALRPNATHHTWWRWAGPPVTTVGELQDQWFRTYQFQGGEPGQLRALDGLDAWQVYFYRGNSWSNCQSTGNVGVVSRPASGASAPGGLPAREATPEGVRMVLHFAPGSGQNGSITRDLLFAP